MVTKWACSSEVGVAQAFEHPHPKNPGYAPALQGRYLDTELYMYLLLVRNFVCGLCCMQDGLRNLFSRAGKVNRVFLQKAKTGQSHTFG